MIRSIRGAALGACFVAASGLLPGCSNDENTPEAKIAAEAVGVEPTDGTKKTTEVQRDLDVYVEKKVVDHKTGEVLHDETQVTPVTVKQEKQVKPDVDVDVGESQATTPKK